MRQTGNRLAKGNLAGGLSGHGDLDGLTEVTRLDEAIYPVVGPGGLLLLCTVPAHPVNQDRAGKRLAQAGDDLLRIRQLGRCHGDQVRPGLSRKGIRLTDVFDDGDVVAGAFKLIL